MDRTLTGKRLSVINNPSDPLSLTDSTAQSIPAPASAWTRPSMTLSTPL